MKHVDRLNGTTLKAIHVFVTRLKLCDEFRGLENKLNEQRDQFVDELNGSLPNLAG